MNCLTLKKYILTLCFLFIITATAFAQPTNDNCTNASVINITGSGFGLGTFTSLTDDITKATVQSGETYAPAIFVAGQDKKSIWYKFTLPTTRSVKVTLQQPGTAIAAGDAGFAVYKTSNCVPGSGDISSKFTPIAKFGSSFHPCVDPGDYLIQVSSTTAANGPLYVQLDIGEASASDFDHPKDAYDFGVLSTSRKQSDFYVECQSLEDANERCPVLSNNLQYTKSTWHTFTTPAYFDYISVWLASPNCRFTNGLQTFGYTLYKGDAKTSSSIASLTPVDACDSLVSDGNTAGYKIYRCDDLQPNTTYSVQIFYNEDFKDNVRLNINYNGSNATLAPEPILSKVPASNQLGIVGSASGTTKYANDYFGCNSRHSLHPCNPSLPANGILYNNIRYDLSTFYTFQLATGADIQINASASCGNLLVRLYNQNLSNDCTSLDTANIISQAQGNISETCLPPGTYTAQICGTDSMQRTYFNCGSSGGCLFSNLSQQISFQVYAKNTKTYSDYSLTSADAYDAINASGGVMGALQNGTSYTSNIDTFGCSRTVLPPAPLNGNCRSDITKSIYREFVIGDANGDNKADSGVLVLDQVDGNYYSYSSLYKGDANTLAASLNVHAYNDTITGLAPFSQCLSDHYCGNYNQLCVTPGTYTLVTFGSDDNKGAATRPVIKFNLVTTKHYSAATAQDMGSVLDTVAVKGGTFYSDRDTFSCYDNAVIINGYAPPNINNHPATKAIYRQFYLSAPSGVRICSASSSCESYNNVMRIFSGRASDGLDKLTFLSSSDCFTAGGCAPMAAGWYTVVFYGSGATYDKPSQNLNDYGYSGAVGYYTQFSITINTSNQGDINRFSLNTNNAYDSINYSGGAMQPLQNTLSYPLEKDTFGCSSTVITQLSTGSCISKPAKASYHEFVIGDANKDNLSDSGILTLESYEVSSYSTILYKGDAASLSALQNAHSFGDTIRNLPAYTQCLPGYYCTPPKICATPGTYTLVTLTDSARTGTFNINARMRFNITATKHYDGATAQNMGSVLDSIDTKGNPLPSDVDTFTCIDNAVTINGYPPPTINNHPATKAIYREFYLSSAADVDICTPNYGCEFYGGAMIVFSGKASDGLNTLTFLSDKNCFSTTPCAPLAAGWYTVVCYGSGPTFQNPSQYINEDGYGSAVGHYNQFTIRVTKACPGPQFNRPYKAAIDTTTKQPFLLEWKPRKGSTEAYPITDTTYTLYDEHFNCTEDTPFTVVKPCGQGLNRTIYYVFKINQESFLQINTQGLLGEVFSGDSRTDSASFKTATPIQPCLSDNGYIQLCSLQPGSYTLIMFAGDRNVYNGCGSADAPTIYIDAVNYSRFDHASKAYDFGTIPSDSIYHSGKVGDVNPLDAGRAASNDFFYCTTGAQTGDPTESSCRVAYNPNVYNTNPNNHLFDSSFLPGYPARRNLWYTFVIDQPGNVHVKVTNPTSDKKYRHPFAVYKSDVDGSLPFATVVSSGQVDSTKAQGLSVIDYNLRYSYYCNPNDDEISFYRDPCTTVGPNRYYVLVDNNSSNAVNSQAEVSVLLDTVNLISTKFDHYYLANNIGTVDTGNFSGEQDNYSCASADATDPTNDYQYCAKKTLWYKFTATISGHVKYRIYINGKVQSYSRSDLQLFREITPGDSTSKGLSYITPSSYYDNASRTYWGGNCVAPGTYYLLVTGCNRSNEYEYPEVRLEEEAGDFCSAPVVAAISGVESTTASAIVDCHTIGTDYGEFAPQLSCPPNANTADYKSSWFRMDIGGKDTLDVTVYLDENTNANPDQIKYRLMTGDCGAMQEQSCVLDSRTRNTYRCLIPGKSYYVQVFTPVKQTNSYTLITGDVILNLSSVKHTDTCAPDVNCLAIARFIPQFDCTKDDDVKFVNYSTYGSGIQYKWDFGYNNQTDTTVSPSFFYPALDKEATYNVKLSMLNKSCNGKDSITVPVTIPARPHVDLGKDIIACNPDTTISLNATSFPGATYYWQNGSTDPIYNVYYKGENQYRVKVTYNGCISNDTINVFVNDLKKYPSQTAVICQAEDSAKLYPGYYYNVTYSWNTGETNNSIYAKTTDTYWVDVSNDYCTVRDSFAVTSIGDAHPLGNDTTVCFSAIGYTINATAGGADSYRWDDGSSNPQRTVSDTGTYWVDVDFGSCTVRDSLTIKGGREPSATIISYPLCTGDSAMLTVLDSMRQYHWSTGDTTQTIYVKEAGSYSVETIDSNHCRTATVVPVNEVPNPIPKIEGSTVLCNIDSVVLAINEDYLYYSWNTGDSTFNTAVSKPGMVTVEVTNDNGCKGSDTVFVTTPSSPLTASFSAALCNGSVYIFPSGKQESNAGTYQDTVRSAGGCDSLVTTIVLTTSAPQTVSLSSSVCAGNSYVLPSGKQVSEAGLYADTLRSASGCDSVISNVDLHIISPLATSSVISLCTGAGYTLPNGITVTEPGVYPDTIRSVSGCDSVINVITLSVPAPVSTEFSASICSGKVYTLPSGKTADAPGDYSDTLHSILGCDSLYSTIHLSLLTPVAVSQSASICAGIFYTLPSGKQINTTGIYNDTLRTVAGCDSLFTAVDLHVTEATSQSINASLCSGETYLLPSGKQVSKAGVYMDTLKTSQGCDSLVSTITIDVKETIRQSNIASVCAGETYTLPWGATATTAGAYSDTLRSEKGCDSLLQTVVLSVLSPVNKTAAASICAGQKYVLPSGKEVSEAGVYKDTIKSNPGCDSVITTVTLSVISSPSLQNAVALICSGDTYTLPSGKQVYDAGNYQDTLRSAGGCDSLIIITNLSLQPRPTVDLHPTTASLCPGDSVLLSASGGQGYDWSPNGYLSSVSDDMVWVYPVSTTAYKVVITDRVCHDSLYATVTVNPTPLITIKKSNDIGCRYKDATLTASGGKSYMWSPADSTIINPTTDNPVVKPTVTTTYHVKATSDNDCTSESSITVSVTPGQGGDYNLPKAFTPNGDGVNDCFGVKSWGMITNLKFQVFDRTGKLLFETHDPSKCWDGTWKGQRMDAGTYVYQASADNNCGHLYKKWWVVLIR